MYKKLTDENRLSIHSPDIAKEWDYNKNINLTPNDVSYGSTKKVWWICPKCENSWNKAIFNRTTHGSNCPRCSSKKIKQSNENFDIIYKQLVKEWDINKNFGLTLEENDLNLDMKAWWKCEKGHEWQEEIGLRLKGRKCPYCYYKKVEYEKSLAFLYPEIAKEWHPTKNGDITPSIVARGSKLKVWWKCEKGHEWQATINSRTGEQKNGCSQCNMSKFTSFPEQAILYYINKHFPCVNRHNVYHLGKKYEIDIFIPQLNVGIEYDGGYWHQTKHSIKRDENKNEIFNEMGINLIRIRHQSLPIIQNHSSKVYITTQTNESLNNIIYDIISDIYEQHNSMSKKDIDIDIERDNIKIIDNIQLLEKQNSLEFLFPEIAEQWHPSKNGSLKPIHVSYSSNVKIWWLCPICNEEWKQTPNARTNNNHNCPYCSGTKAGNSNCVSQLYPHLIKEWHPTKNGDFTLDKVTKSSDKEMWWLCPVCGHEWCVSVKNRTKGSGCPICARVKRPDVQTYRNNKIQNIKYEESLEFIFPNLLEEWHPIKNGDLKPSEIKPKSGIKVWWKCKTCGNEWYSQIRNRTDRSTGCPNCFKEGRYSKDKKYLYKCKPELIEEWDFQKNNELGLDFYKMTTGSNHIKAFWKCKKGHSFESRISDRARGYGCPYCNNQKVCLDNCLETIHPEVSKYWHPTKNGLLTPKDITFANKKSVWWKCKKCNHEWENKICNVIVSKNEICPVCRISEPLSVKYPVSLEYWDYEKNGDLKPNMISYGSKKEVWWICPHCKKSYKKSPYRFIKTKTKCDLCRI